MNSASTKTKYHCEQERRYRNEVNTLSAWHEKAEYLHAIKGWEIKTPSGLIPRCSQTRRIPTYKHGSG